MGRSSISVRGLAAIAAACTLLCVAAASASAAPLVWTSNSKEGSVSTIDGATGKELGKPIPVGEDPLSVAVTPDGRRAVVADNGGKAAVVIDTASRKVVKSIPLPDVGEGVAISPDGAAAYVTSESDEVFVVDPETATDVGTVELGVEASSAVAFSPDGRLAYIGVRPDEIAAVDTRTEKVVGSSIKLAGRPTLIALTPDGETAYVIEQGVAGVAVVDTALGQVVKTITTSEEPRGIAVSPDGQRLYVGLPTETAKAFIVVNTTTDATVGSPIEVPGGAWEIAISPDGKTAYVASDDEVTPINLATKKAEAPIEMSADEIFHLAITPDQSPVAAFTAPANVTAGAPATFSGAASTDPDGSIASYAWAFGDSGTATGISATHAYRAAGSYEAKLSVVDDEGCGEEVVFTGRTAYCSGAAPAVHPVSVKATTTPPVEPIVGPSAPPSNKFSFGRIVHNLRNGTVRVQVKLRSAGYIFLFGKKVHAVTRKSKGPQSMWLTLHARVELAKRLKKTLRAPVRFRVTFTPNGGTAKTVHRSVTLQRAPRHKHGRH